MAARTRSLSSGASAAISSLLSRNTEASLYEGDRLLFAIHLEGISRKTFAWGIFVTLFFVFLVARWPQHSWVGLLGGDLVMIPLWYWHVTQYRAGHLFIIDLCWFMNLVFVVVFTLHFSDYGVFSKTARLWFFVSFFMQANAYLAWAVMVLNQGLIFHSNERMASLFCHMFPSIVTLCMRTRMGGHTAAVHTAWPGFFPDIAEIEGIPLLQVFLAGILPYVGWWILYSTWAILIGVNCPPKYATVFDNVYNRMKLKPLFNRTGYTTYRSHCVLYLLAHFVIVIASYAVCLIFWRSYVAHVVWVMIELVFCVWSGTEYFFAIDVKKFGPMLVQREDLYRRGKIESPYSHTLKAGK